MDRCALAFSYHKQGYNCAQAVAAAFADRTGLSLEQTMAVSGGFGGGVGGSHAELCGAISGGVIVLSLLFPHLDGSNSDSKRRVYRLSREFRSRFEAVFGRTCCGELLKARPGLNEQTNAAARLGLTAHCDIMIVTAVELLEQLLEEEMKA